MLVALADLLDEQPDIVDARLEGYASSVTLPPSGSVMSYFLLIVLAAVTCGGLFKDSKRSHLD